MICLVVFASHFGCLFVTVDSTLSFLFVCLSFKFFVLIFVCVQIHFATALDTLCSACSPFPARPITLISHTPRTQRLCSCFLTRLISFINRTPCTRLLFSRFLTLSSLSHLPRTVRSTHSVTCARPQRRGSRPLVSSSTEGRCTATARRGGSSVSKERLKQSRQGKSLPSRAGLRSQSFEQQH
jgi:hypothetical protein